MNWFSIPIYTRNLAGPPKMLRNGSDNVDNLNEVGEATARSPSVHSLCERASMAAFTRLSGLSENLGGI